MENEERIEFLDLVSKACAARNIGEARLASLYGDGRIVETIRNGKHGPYPKTLRKFRAFLLDFITEDKS